jgi:hypothetical protein
MDDTCPGFATKRNLHRHFCEHYVKKFRTNLTKVVWLDLNLGSHDEHSFFGRVDKGSDSQNGLKIVSTQKALSPSSSSLSASMCEKKRTKKTG